MGLFTDKDSYEEIKCRLKPKDGSKHILLIHTSISNGNKPGDVYTDKINSIIENMQISGYEILNVELAIGGSQGLFYETLITYQ